MGKITRFEMINSKTNERIITITPKEGYCFKFDLQDNGRTLKVFTEDNNDKRSN